MNCHDAKELLSAYHDQELSAVQQAEVASHVEECASCAKELASFNALSNLIGSLEVATPSQSMWQQVDRQRDSSPGAEPASQQRRNSVPLKQWLALAAIALLAVGILWPAPFTQHDHDDHAHFAAQFGEYLDEFRQDPVAAQNSLLALYPHRAVKLDQMIQEVGYRPAVANGLPDGYRAEATHVMDMPCCKCVQTVCRRPDGSLLAVFEHDDDNAPLWFGSRTETTAQCKGKQCCLVDLDDQLAATWKQEERYITLIGVRDISEVQQFVAALGEQQAKVEQVPPGAT